MLESVCNVCLGGRYQVVEEIRREDAIDDVQDAVSREDLFADDGAPVHSGTSDRARVDEQPSETRIVIARSIDGDQRVRRAVGRDLFDRVKIERDVI
jgi:hypothetical protein